MRVAVSVLVSVATVRRGTPADPRALAMPVEGFADSGKHSLADLESGRRHGRTSALLDRIVTAAYTLTYGVHAERARHSG